MSESAFKIEWIDAGREPQCAPNPDYPDGIDVDYSGGAKSACTVKIDYPAKRCGHYTIKCQRCGSSLVCSTAGRPDDPRSVKLPCKELLQ